MFSLGLLEFFSPDKLSPEQLEHEKEVRTNSYSLKSWLYYIQAKKEEESKLSERIQELDGSDGTYIGEVKQELEIERRRLVCCQHLLYERALDALPGSYKLWFRYLTGRVVVAKTLCLDDAFIDETNDCFERCLSILPKMPKLWTIYCEFLTWQRRITFTRLTFDRALRALPITQHSLVWPLYIKFIRIANVTETAVRVYRRYVKLFPLEVEEFIEYLLKHGRLDEACVMLCKVVNDDSFESKKKRSKFDLWSLLCQVMVRNPKQVTSVDVDAIIRGGIRKYPAEIGKLWVNLAEYYVRSGEFEKARDIYEEAIGSVATVRDFTIAFDAYARFEESVIEMKSAALEEMDTETADVSSEQNSCCEEKSEVPSTSEVPLADLTEDLKLRMERYSELIEKRHALLMNAVLLRQNPHNIEKWLERVDIYINKIEPPNAEMALETFQQALVTVDCRQTADRMMSDLWLAYARFFEDYDEDLESGLKNARAIFTTATERKNRSKFKNAEDIATLWCEWIEMELRNKKWSEARKVCALAVTSVSKSKRVWGLYADIEESLGTLDEAKAVYSKMLDLRLATVTNILNFAELLERKDFFEESFKVFERGIDIFEKQFPHVTTLWKCYLHKFIERYEGSKLERVRDLFELCLAKCPAKESRDLWLLYARIEEKYGYARHAMRVYDKACERMSQGGDDTAEDCRVLFNVYISRAADLFGASRTREIYDKAIATVKHKFVPQLCVSFVELELKLSEIDRCRAILTHGAQFANPKTHAEYWKRWYDFEVDYGNDDTFAEMIRTRRSAEAASTSVQFSEEFEAEKKRLEKAAGDLAAISTEDAADAMRELETEALILEGKDPMEIDLSDASKVLAADGDDIELEIKQVPMSVFKGQMA